MILKLTLFSQEKEDFVLEILIDNDATFSDLHELILKDCKYAEHQRQSFLICDEEWRVKHRICLQENEETSYDMDINLMSDTRIGDFLEDEGQRLAYVFDPEDKRFFLMELTENVFGRHEKKAVVNRRHGQPPLQNLLQDDGELAEQEVATVQNEGEDDAFEEDFYGDDGFEDEELDMEGYEIDE